MLLLPQFFSTVKEMLQMGLHGKHRGGSYLLQHSYDLLPKHSTKEQFHFGFELWQVSSEVFEVQKLKSLQEEGVGVVEPQEVVLDGLALLAPIRSKTIVSSQNNLKSASISTIE